MTWDSVQQVLRIVLDNAVTHGGDALCVCVQEMRMFDSGILAWP